MGEKIIGGFQQKFLLKVNKKIFLDDFQHPIDKVIRKGAKTSLVRFLGYTERDDAWVPNSKIDEPYIKIYLILKNKFIIVPGVMAKLSYLQMRFMPSLFLWVMQKLVDLAERFVKKEDKKPLGHL